MRQPQPELCIVLIRTYQNILFMAKIQCAGLFKLREFMLADLHTQALYLAPHFARRLPDCMT